jgi:quercetin dioxygenase-like cupin family protein
MAVHHVKAGEIVDLHPLRAVLKVMKTTALVKSKAFEAVRLVVRAGEKIAAHQVAGVVMLHCLEGRVRLDLADSVFELCAGEWVYLDGGAQHSVVGIEDSSLLLTILFEC